MVVAREEIANGHAQLSESVQIEDLSREDELASRGGVQRVEERLPPAAHVRGVAAHLMLIFGISIVLTAHHRDCLVETSRAEGRLGLLQHHRGHLGDTTGRRSRLLLRPKVTPWSGAAP